MHDMPNQPPSTWLTASQVADLFDVDQSTISRWASQQLIPSHSLPSGRRRYRRDEIEALLNKREASA